MKSRFIFSVLFWGCICSFFFSCSDENSLITEDERLTTDEQYHANIFASDALNIYYYWNEEIAADIAKLDPETNTDPIATVNEIRYHEGETYIDKWTMLTDNMSSIENAVQGVDTSFGYELAFYYLGDDYTNLYGVVVYVYSNSPADKAGMRRGDIIYALNGASITEDNYMDLYDLSQVQLSIARMSDVDFTLKPVSEITLQAEEIYENPILCHQIFDVNGKKVAYLAYSSFDLKSIEPLIEICKNFKAEGVKDLILDLRYNSGGYVITEKILASMLSPQDVVTARKVLSSESYNKLLTEEYRKQGYTDFNTYFETEYNYPENSLNVSTKDANIGLEHIYALIGPNTASASESILSGLMPYMKVTLIGTQSAGKYCTGLMLKPEDVYEEVPPEISKWGIYVMISIYKNALGETPCMPDGLTPDIVAYDSPYRLEQLGDENEVLLKVALQTIGKVYPEESALRTSAIPRMKAMPLHNKANFGKRILLKSQLRNLQ